MLKQQSRLNLADVAVAKRNIQNQFLLQAEKLIDWSVVEEKLKDSYKKGRRLDGRPAYPGLLLFKMCLLLEWYQLSPVRLYQTVNDSISFSYFTGLSLEDEVPSGTTIAKFKKELIKNGSFPEFIEIVNQCIDAKKLKIRKGIIRHAALHRV